MKLDNMMGQMVEITKTAAGQMGAFMDVKLGATEGYGNEAGVTKLGLLYQTGGK